MGFWSKFGKIASIAAPIIAAPFTGGATLALLGAGAGIGGAALDKKTRNWKGMLTGGALGAIPGLSGAGKAAGAIAPSLTQGLKSVGTQALKSAATNFGTGAAAGGLTGGGWKGALQGGAQSSLSGMGQGGAGGFKQALTTGAKNAAKTAGTQIGSNLLQKAGVPGANVFANYLGNSLISRGSGPGTDGSGAGGFQPGTGMGGFGGGFQPKPGGGFNWGSLAQTGANILGGLGKQGGGGGGGTGPYLPSGSPGTTQSGGGGGATPSAPSFNTGGGGGGFKPGDNMKDWQSQGAGDFWSKYGGLIGQAGGIVGGIYAGKAATKSAAQRSAEEQAALRGMSGTAGTAGRLAGQFATQGQQYLRQPANYFSSLLSGNRAQMNNIVAPAVAQITGNYRGANRALEHSGMRGAARDVASADLNRQRASQVAGLTTGVQNYAAEQLAGLGQNMAGLAPGLLNTSGILYGNMLDSGFQNRKYSREEGGKTGEAIGGLARDVGETIWGKGGGQQQTGQAPPAGGIPQQDPIPSNTIPGSHQPWGTTPAGSPGSVFRYPQAPTGGSGAGGIQPTDWWRGQPSQPSYTPGGIQPGATGGYQRPSFYPGDYAYGR